MFQRLIDDARDSAGRAMRQTVLIVAVAASLFVTTSFLCAAAFVAVLDRFGLVPACLAGAGIFFIVTLIAALSYALGKRRPKPPVEEKPQQKSAVQSALMDPMMLATGLQIVRAIGIKKLIPMLAIGGVALGYLASRGNAPADEDTPADE